MVSYFPNNRTALPQPKHLWFLILLYTMIMITCNWFDHRLIHIFGIDTRAGSLIFPFTFLVTDLITEVYGFKLARRAIWCGLLFNLFFVLYGQLIIHLPNPGHPTQNDVFDLLHSKNTRITIASIISYFCAEPLNSILMAKIKIKMNGKHMAFRFLFSNVIASGLDSLIFTTLAFYGNIDPHPLIRMAFGLWFIKIFIGIMGLPFSVYLARKLKNQEQLDIYDTRTNFYMFSFDDKYKVEDNKFQLFLSKRVTAPEVRS